MPCTTFSLSPPPHPPLFFLSFPFLLFFCFQNKSSKIEQFIRAENVKSLVEHVVERFSASFLEVLHSATLEGIKLKHEQNVDLRENHDRDFGLDGGGGGGLAAGGGGGAGGGR